MSNNDYNHLLPNTSIIDNGNKCKTRNSFSSSSSKNPSNNLSSRDRSNLNIAEKIVTHNNSAIYKLKASRNDPRNSKNYLKLRSLIPNPYVLNATSFKKDRHTVQKSPNFGLVFFNLSPLVTTEQIHNQFDDFGYISKIHLARDPSTGMSLGISLIEFGYLNEADSPRESAMNAFKNLDFLTSRFPGSKIQVNVLGKFVADSDPNTRSLPYDNLKSKISKDIKIPQNISPVKNKLLTKTDHQNNSAGQPSTDSLDSLIAVTATDISTNNGFLNGVLSDLKYIPPTFKEPLKIFEKLKSEFNEPISSNLIAQLSNSFILDIKRKVLRGLIESKLSLIIDKNKTETINISKTVTKEEKTKPAYPQIPSTNINSILQSLPVFRKNRIKDANLTTLKKRKISSSDEEDNAFYLPESESKSNINSNFNGLSSNRKINRNKIKKLTENKYSSDEKSDHSSNNQDIDSSDMSMSESEEESPGIVNQVPQGNKKTSSVLSEYANLPDQSLKMSSSSIDNLIASESDHVEGGATIDDYNSHESNDSDCSTNDDSNYIASKEIKIKSISISKIGTRAQKKIITNTSIYKNINSSSNSDIEKENSFTATKNYRKTKKLDKADDESLVDIDTLETYNGPLSRNSSGSARTQGYYKIPKSEKSRYLLPLLSCLHWSANFFTSPRTNISILQNMEISEKNRLEIESIDANSEILSFSSYKNPSFQHITESLGKSNGLDSLDFKHSSSTHNSSSTSKSRSHRAANRNLRAQLSEYKPSTFSSSENLGNSTSRKNGGLSHDKSQVSTRNSSSVNVTNVLNFNSLESRKKSLFFAKSGIHDYGLFTRENIYAGEFVIEYIGEIIRSSLADLREHRYHTEYGLPSDCCYLFRIDNETVIDATLTGNIARFVNHSCDPNCMAKVIVADGSKRIGIYAKTDIGIGDEITYDYKFSVEDSEDKIPCLCGAAACRGYLN
ncbi:Histone-lysine N-methyltransferase SETD1 [Smittium culicis]|uniref:Histone-lysine N-methyltransferase, H3 lysine-4 specific n=1 Tax=Smittium culicis TaxID=133412 RepID=A0A1R1XQE4_9FUNG|nr:Histone-lysine N-methyltransferase SETD1 [Smittium culicis]